jgi:aminoglycoside phosphotransferase (APT) family kinase protein
VIAHANPTTDGLLAALRRSTSRPAMEWSRPPVPLAGGFWAEMYDVELADAPCDLDGRLVARVMPDPATAAFETAVQRHLTRFGFPVPAIRCAAGPSSDLDRAWSLMDFVPGQPLLAGLSATTAIRQAPTLLRRLPDVLAEAAAALHQCPVDGLHSELTGHARQADVHDFLGRLAAQAAAIGRYDFERTADHLAATAHDTRVICHGDLHPFNLLVDGERWTLIDWSTAVVADPHYDLAFTTLMLANPPLGGPAPVRAATRAIGGRLAERFMRSYEQRSGRPVDTARIAWGRRAHALRALVEIATWEANGQLDAHRGHPWLMMRPVLEAHLPAARATLAPNASTRPEGGST